MHYIDIGNLKLRFIGRETEWKRLLEIEIVSGPDHVVDDVQRYYLEQKSETTGLDSLVRFNSTVEVIEFFNNKHHPSSKLDELSSIAYNLKKK
jgi:hypothetical protein